MDTIEKKRWLARLKQHHVATTPYMLTDLDVIAENCRNFKRLFPTIELYYAIKAFPDKEILKAIAQIVDGFDAASIEEINGILDVGVAPQRITFSNPVKPVSSVSEAKLHGLKKFAFQSRDELGKLARHASGVSVYVRVKMDDRNSEVPLSSKYGCNFDEAFDLLLQAEYMGLKPKGVTFHVGSQQLSITPWIDAISKSQIIINQARVAGLECDSINLGGGFPARYHQEDLRLEDMASAINGALGQYDISYLAEPGRCIVADSSVIVSTIIGIERRGNEDWLFLDVGLYQAFVGSLRHTTFPYMPFLLSAKSVTDDEAEYQSYTITGPSCDSQDIICYNAILPKNLQLGDRLVFPNTGAYTIVYGANFNGFEVPRRFFLGGTKKGG